MSNLKLTNWDKNLAFTLDTKGEVIATNALSLTKIKHTLNSIVHIGPNFANEATTPKPQDVDFVTPTELKGCGVFVDAPIVATGLTSIVFTLQHATTLDGTYEDAFSFTHTAANSGTVLKGVYVVAQIPMGKVMRSYVKLQYAGVGTGSNLFTKGTITALLGTCVATTPLTGYQRKDRHSVFTGR